MQHDESRHAVALAPTPRPFIAPYRHRSSCQYTPLDRETAARPAPPPLGGQSGAPAPKEPPACRPLGAATPPPQLARPLPLPYTGIMMMGKSSRRLMAKTAAKQPKAAAASRLRAAVMRGGGRGGMGRGPLARRAWQGSCSTAAGRRARTWVHNAAQRDHQETVLRGGGHCIAGRGRHSLAAWLPDRNWGGWGCNAPYTTGNPTSLPPSEERVRGMDPPRAHLLGPRLGSIGRGACVQAGHQHAQAPLPACLPAWLTCGLRGAGSLRRAAGAC